MVNKKGYTLVEMIVSFALLTMFMASIAATLAPVTKQYQKIQKVNHLQNIEDGILESVKSYIQQADDTNEDGTGGYIKLRAVESSTGIPKTVPVHPDATTGAFKDYRGSVLEFQINGFSTVMDTRGYYGYKSKDANDSGATLSNYFAYEPGYLSIRYFMQKSSDHLYRDTDMGVGEPDPTSSLYSEFSDLQSEMDGSQKKYNDGVNRYIAFGAYQCFNKNFYMGYRTKVTYVIPEEAFTVKDGDVYVNYILVTCRVSDKSLTVDDKQYSSDTIPIYFKNPLKYETGVTSMRYSD
jgi:type II secretory pathway pseudopilin PulG